tara:strand:- start:15140 stop:16042 length:903 start_codon:yes stop_codon:yes gene_type:complete
MLDLVKKSKKKDIVIVINNTEKYGIKSYCYEYKKYLKKNGITSNVIEKSFWSAFFYIFMHPKIYAILNTKHGLLSIFFRKRTAYILHGFPTIADYGLLKFTIIALVHKISSYFSSHTISNSFLTYEVNYKFFKTKSNEIWNPEVHADKNITNEINYEKKKPSLLFVGRLIKAKGVHLIARYLQGNYHKFSNIEFIGDGDNNLLSSLSELSNVKITNYLSNEVLNSKYSEHDIFISLNFFEPYGFVYQEALSNNMIVVLPRYSGIIGHVSMSDKVILVNSSQEEEITSAFNRALLMYKKII